MWLATLAPLAGAALVFLVALACGTLVLVRLNLVLTRGEDFLFRFLTGSACLSVLVLALAALQLAYAQVFCLTALVLFGLAWIPRRDRVFETLPKTSGAWALLAVVAALPFLYLYFFTAWAPEYSPDGSTYHLGNVRLFAEHGGLIPIRDLYGALPEGLEMLFLFAFTIGRHSAAALVHFSFLLVLPFLIYSYGRRFGSARAGVVGALLVFVSPVFGKTGVSAYNDVALATVVFGVFYLIELWLDKTRLDKSRLEKQDDRFLILAGILAGFAFGIKYTGFVAAFYALLLILQAFWRDRRWRPLWLFLAPCFLLVLPWLIKDAIYLHNPLSPFFNRLFPNPWISPRFESEYSRLMAQTAGISNPLSLYIAYTITGAGGVVGILGPLVALFPLGIVVARTARGRRLLLAALLFGAPVFANQGARFLMMAMPPAALAFALSVTETPFVAPVLIVLGALSCWPGILGKYCDRYGWRPASEVPVAAAWHRRRTQAFLHAHMGDDYDMALLANATTPSGSRIFCQFSCLPQAYLERDSLLAYESTEGNALSDMLLVPLQPARQPQKHITFTFPAQPVSRIRVAAPHLRPDQLWQVHELRVLNGGAEVPRSTAWRIDAWPDPWEARFAFDGNLASRWSTEQPGASGAWLEVDFGRPIRLDSVRIECAKPEVEDLAVFADSGSGEIAPLKTSIRVETVAPPPGMRRAAVLMLEHLGFQYLFMKDSDYNSADFQLRMKSWGVRSVARTGTDTLFHLE